MTNPMSVDKEAIRNWYVWMPFSHERLELSRKLLEENEQIQQLREDHTALQLAWQNVNDENQQLREELEKSRGSHMFRYGLSLETEIARLKEELEQVKKELELVQIQSNHDFYANRTVRSLLKQTEEELAAKDKVLEKIKHIIWDMDIHPTTREARINILIDSILSQYQKE